METVTVIHFVLKVPCTPADNRRLVEW